jgi:DNA-binding NarL/FixJ family response regulator
MRQDLEKTREFVCVGAYGSAYEALAEIPKVRPHVVLMDIRMPGMDGHECFRRLKIIMVQLKIIIVTGLLDTDTMTKSLEAGADGYLTKPAGVAQFLAMLKLTVREGMPFREVSGSHRYGDILKTGSPLTVRENQIMTLIAKGFPFKEVADHLGISFSAVHKHQHNSFRKLGVSNRTEALNKWWDNNHP